MANGLRSLNDMTHGTAKQKAIMDTENIGRIVAWLLNAANLVAFVGLGMEFASAYLCLRVSPNRARDGLAGIPIILKFVVALLVAWAIGGVLSDVRLINTTLVELNLWLYAASEAAALVAVAYAALTVRRWRLTISPNDALPPGDPPQPF